MSEYQPERILIVEDDEARCAWFRGRFARHTIDVTCDARRRPPISERYVAGESSSGSIILADDGAQQVVRSARPYHLFHHCHLIKCLIRASLDYNVCAFTLRIQPDALMPIDLA